MASGSSPHSDKVYMILLWLTSPDISFQPEITRLPKFSFTHGPWYMLFVPPGKFTFLPLCPAQPTPSLCQPHPCPLSYVSLNTTFSETRRLTSPHIKLVHLLPLVILNWILLVCLSVLLKPWRQKLVLNLHHPPQCLAHSTCSIPISDWMNEWTKALHLSSPGVCGSNLWKAGLLSPGLFLPHAAAACWLSRQMGAEVSSALLWSLLSWALSQLSC